VPCGGDPFGEWRSSSLDASGFGLTFQGSSGSFSSKCEGGNVSFNTDAKLSLALKSGDAAQLYLSPTVSSYELLESCVQSATHSGCSSVFTAEGSVSCTSGSCGLCSCKATNPELSLAGNWTTSGTTLTVSNGSLSWHLEYCVSGSTMTVRDVWSGLVFTMVPGFTSGAPMPCAARTASECTHGLWCSLGACTGATNCPRSISETACLTHQGCSWSTTTCTGNVPATCSFSDYGRVPGCVYLDAPPDSGAPSEPDAAPAPPAAIGEPCDQGTDCQSGACCQVKRQSGSSTICLASCTKLPVAGPCVIGTDCESGLCAGWCGKPCTTDADCGTNYWSDTPGQNVCTPRSSGIKYCFPTCAGPVGACSIYDAARCIDDPTSGKLICTL
jgi:hypothetical protein